jgi:hypothetical protein
VDFAKPLGAWFGDYGNLTFNDEVVWPMDLYAAVRMSGKEYSPQDPHFFQRYSVIMVGLKGSEVFSRCGYTAGLEKWVHQGGILILTGSEGVKLFGQNMPGWVGGKSWSRGEKQPALKLLKPDHPLAQGLNAKSLAELKAGPVGILEPKAGTSIIGSDTVSFLTVHTLGKGKVIFLGGELSPHRLPLSVEGQITHDLGPVAIQVWKNLVSFLNLPKRTGVIQDWWRQRTETPDLVAWWRYENEVALGGALYMPPYPQPGEELTSLDFELGKGERSWKYFFVTTNATPRLLRIVPTDLTGPGGAIIKASELSVSIQEKPWPAYPKAPYWLVDPTHVMPLDSPDVKLEANRTYTYWLKVRCPDVPAGDYQGHLAFRRDTEPVHQIPIKVRVWPLRQPEPDVLHYELEHSWWVMPGGLYTSSEPHRNNPDLIAEYMTHLKEMGVDFGQNYGEIYMGYADTHLPPYTRIKESGVRLTDWLAENPNAFDDPYDPEALPHIDYSCYDAMYFDNAVAAGFTDFAMNYGKPDMTAVEERKMAWRLTEYATYLKERGFPEVYTKINDEFDPSGVDAFIDSASFIRRCGFKTYTTTPNFQYDRNAVRKIDPYLDMWQWWPIEDWDRIRTGQNIPWDPANELWAYGACSYWANLIDYTRGAGWAIAYGRFEGLHTHGYARWRWNDHEGVLPAYELDYSPNDSVMVITNSQSVYQARYLAALYRWIEYARQRGLAASTVAEIESELPKIIGPGEAAIIRIVYDRSYVAVKYGPDARGIYPEFVVSPKVFETAKLKILQLMVKLKEALGDVPPSLKYGNTHLVHDGEIKCRIVADDGSSSAEKLAGHIETLTGRKPVISSTVAGHQNLVTVYVGVFPNSGEVKQLIDSEIPGQITRLYPAKGHYAIKHLSPGSQGEIILVLGGDRPGVEKGVSGFCNFLVSENRW